MRRGSVSAASVPSGVLVLRSLPAASSTRARTRYVPSGSCESSIVAARPSATAWVGSGRQTFSPARVEPQPRRRRPRNASLASTWRRVGSSRSPAARSRLRRGVGSNRRCSTVRRSWRSRCRPRHCNQSRRVQSPGAGTLSFVTPLPGVRVSAPDAIGRIVGASGAEAVGRGDDGGGGLVRIGPADREFVGGAPAFAAIERGTDWQSGGYVVDVDRSLVADGEPAGVDRFDRERVRAIAEAGRCDGDRCRRRLRTGRRLPSCTRAGAARTERAVDVRAKRLIPVLSLASATTL